MLLRNYRPTGIRWRVVDVFFMLLSCQTTSDSSKPFKAYNSHNVGTTN